MSPLRILALATEDGVVFLPLQEDRRGTARLSLHLPIEELNKSDSACDDNFSKNWPEADVFIPRRWPSHAERAAVTDPRSSMLWHSVHRRSCGRPDTGRPWSTPSRIFWQRP